MEAVKLKTLDDLLMTPEARVELIAHEFDGDTYRVIATLQEPDRTTARIPPFDAIELDLAQLLGATP